MALSLMSRLKKRKSLEKFGDDFVGEVARAIAFIES